MTGVYSIRVATTDDREAPLAEEWPGLTWDRLCDVLRVEVSPEAAALLAEPVADPVRGLTHWHIVALNDPTPLHALPAAEREATMARFTALQGQIRGYADRLAAAGGESNLRLAQGLRLATDLDAGVAQLWSVAGAPLLTGWGRRRARETASPTAILASGRDAAGGGPARGRSYAHGWTWTAALSGGGAPGAAGGTRARFGLGTWWLWLPFWLLVALIGRELLPACGVHLPFVGAAGFCAAPANAALADLQARNSGLRRSIFEAETRLAQTCARSGAAAAPPSSAEIHKRADEAHVRRGRFEVTLAWEGREDLDLYVNCPGGRLYHGARNACGGVLDQDANRDADSAVDHPLEHATWAQDPPPGEYRIIVNYFDHGQPAKPTPFTVVVTSGAEEKTYTGVAREHSREIEVVRLTR
jgi:hypothetical protein